MNMEARGAYITLLSICWLEGSIPNDEIICAQICGYRCQDDSSAIAKALTCFKVDDNDSCRLVHPRLDKERKKQVEFSKDRSEAGKSGAKCRWDKQVTKVKLSHSSAIAKPSFANGKTMANDSSAFASSSAEDTIFTNVKNSIKSRASNLMEIETFFLELELQKSDAEWFWFKCEANGWTNGGEKIKDWKSTVRSWKAGKFIPSQKNKQPELLKREGTKENLKAKIWNPTQS